MQRGRKPKPTALKLLGGNPGKRALNDREPAFSAPDAAPEPPERLSKIAAAEWRRVAGELLATGVLTTVDLSALEAYCSWWALFVRASEELDDPKCLMQTTDSGYESPSGWLSLKKQASDQMHKFMTEFGLTPSSRSRLKVAPREEKDPFEEFLGDPVIGRIA